MELTAMESIGVLILASTVGGLLAIGIAAVFIANLETRKDG